MLVLVVEMLLLSQSSLSNIVPKINIHTPGTRTNSLADYDWDTTAASMFSHPLNSPYGCSRCWTMLLPHTRCGRLSRNGKQFPPLPFACETSVTNHTVHTVAVPNANSVAQRTAMWVAAAAAAAAAAAVQPPLSNAASYIIWMF